MSISGVISSLSSAPLTFQSLQTRISNDFNTIASSLQSNNLSGARQAYADIVQLTHNGAASANSTPDNDFQNLGGALQSGNLSGAQAAFSKFQTDLSSEAVSNGGGHPHRHHHGTISPIAPTTASTTTNSSTAAGFLGSLAQIGLNFLK